MHTHAAHRRAALWLAATAGFIALALATPALSQAEESNPNNYSCLGSLAPGAPEAGSEDQQVNYTFYCNGPITGYQLQSQVPVTGIQSPPLVSKNRIALADSFSCSGEVPGWAVNCVGLAKGGYENITGQFAIGTKLCAEPRVDALLTVTYAYLEKGVITQAISGPFDLGRPSGCKPDAFSGGTRLNPTAPIKKKAKKAKQGKKHTRAKHARAKKK
ncbi:MAG TPA: hypothetical protein VN772_01760 [Solirubrobacteraceae bacterium]|nr:hypothetical protein [Solirubrobacteraceae bacterium]